MERAFKGSYDPSNVTGAKRHLAFYPTVTLTEEQLKHMSIEFLGSLSDKPEIVNLFDTYTIDIPVVTGGIAIILGNPKTVFGHYENITVVATPEEHYHFVEWMGDLAQQAHDIQEQYSTTHHHVVGYIPEFYSDPGLIHISPTFALDQFIFAISINAANGEVSGAFVNSGVAVSPAYSDTDPMDYGTIVAFTGEPAVDYEFIAWSGTAVPAGHETDNPINITIIAGGTLIAQFEHL
jgi:hypothetical protein